MRVVLSPHSQRDLTDLVLYIAEDNPRRARSYAAEIKTVCRSLNVSPERFPAAPELGPAIRYTRHGAYLIFYSIETDHVRIRRVIHSARLIDASMFR